jgi:hypothetical protein
MFFIQFYEPSSGRELCTKKIDTFSWSLGQQLVAAIPARESEAESKEKHGECGDTLPELTITSPYVHFIVDSNTFTMGNPMSKSALFPSKGFGL